MKLRLNPKWQLNSLESASLRFGLLAMLLVTGIMLVLDFRLLTDQVSSAPTSTPATQPVKMDRPTINDQIRPYLPTARPWASPADPNRNKRPRPQGLDEGAPIRFRPVGNGRVLAEGTIHPGAYVAFQTFLDSEPGRRTREIVLHSPGGSVSDAIGMARLVRERQIATIVIEDGYCASSCPLVFAGGESRSAHKRSWIGVHQVYTGNNQFGTLSDGMSHAQRVSADAMSLLHELDVDPRVWVHAMETPKNQLYLLTVDELIEYGLATEIEDENAVDS